MPPIRPSIRCVLRQQSQSCHHHHHPHSTLQSSTAKTLTSTISSSSLSPLSSTSSASSSPSSISSPTTQRYFSSSASRPAAHGNHYDPPSGWLWGVPPGQKYKKEGWETLFFWGFGGSVLLTMVAYAYKPDTSIQTWALEEARRRLEAEGILEDPEAKK